MLFFKILIGRDNNPHIGFDGFSAADPLKFLELNHAKKLNLQIQRKIADLIQKDASRRWPAQNGPACVPSAPVNAPFSWPNSSLSSSVSGSAVQLTLINGFSARKLL